MATELKPISITRPGLLLVEDQASVRFYINFLHALSIRNVYVQEYCGINNLQNKLRLVKKATGFNAVKALGIVRDAEDDSSRALQSLNSALSNNSFPAVASHNSFITAGHLSVGAFIMPGFGTQGSLEDLLLSSVADDPAFPCVESFMDCISKKVQQDRQPKNKSKARMLAFLAGMHEPVNRIDVASGQQVWNFSHNTFSEFAAFLRNLTELSGS
ncbi:MAG: hypothetical protein PHQ23_12085 [Candidatus Wallbacteria bacterium]|nr:hypothetical protein [Candidatus Wallbacteria bacterium]